MCWCRNGSYPGRKISLRDLPLRKPAFVLRQRFLCLRRWMRSWHPCYSRTVSTEQTATTWGLLLVVQTSSGMMFLEYASMHPCMPMPHGFISSYPSIYHTALGPAHRYTRLRGRLAVLIWNPHGQWFEGFELTLDSSGNHLQRISPASNDIHPCSWHEPSHCCNIYVANSRRSMWFIFRNVLIFFIKRFRDFMPIIIPCKCARQPKHSLFC